VIGDKKAGTLKKERKKSPKRKLSKSQVNDPLIPGLEM